MILKHKKEKNTKTLNIFVLHDLIFCFLFIACHYKSQSLNLNVLFFSFLFKICIEIQGEQEMPCCTEKKIKKNSIN